MKNRTLSSLLRKISALFLVGYFSIFSPVVTLALTQPVSAPITIPVPIPVPTPTATPKPSLSPIPTPIPFPGAPEMVYPQNNQTLDLEGAYMFKAKPVPGASGYLFGLFQNNIMVYENYRDTGRLSPNGEFVIWENNPAHAKFKAGDVRVMVRALVNGRWSEARTITITLKPRPTATPRPTPQPTASPTAFPTPRPTPGPIVTTINSIWPVNLKIGKLFIIFGKGFGNSGKINFYSQTPKTDGIKAINYYWSNSLIFGRVPNNIEGNQIYTIQVQPDLTKNFSLVSRYISR